MSRSSKTAVVCRDQCKNCPARPHSAFKAVKDEDLVQIDRLRSLVEYKRDAQLPLEFEGDAGFYCVREGHLKIGFMNRAETGTVRIGGPGDLIGFRSPSEARYLIDSLESGVSCFFSWLEFHTLLANSPSVSQGIIDALCRIIFIKDSRIADLQSFSVKNRVAALLLSLNAKFGEVSTSGSRLGLRLDRKTMARMAATGVESLSRALTELEEDGVLRREGREIDILNEAALESIAAS